MLGDKKIVPSIPVVDMSRAKNFYVNKLGLKEIKEAAGGVLLEAGASSEVFLYERPPSKADHTLASFEVENIEDAVEELSKVGIVFEQYDMSGLKTNEMGIAVFGNEKAAWFKDSEGNILAISQMS